MREKRSGFSLFELIIGLGIGLVLITVLLSIFQDTQRTYTLQSSNGQLQLSSRAALSRIVNRAHQATQVQPTQGSYTTSSSLLILTLPSVDNTNTIIVSTYDYVVYRLNPIDTTKLQEIVIPGPGSARPSVTKTLASSMNTLTFTYYDANSTQLSANYDTTKRLKVRLLAREVRFGRNVDVDYTEQISLRNK